jgi:hypothetical protein
MRYVRTAFYKRSHGVRPYGRGNWISRIGKEKVSISGLYSESRKKAIEIAKENRTWLITIMP